MERSQVPRETAGAHPHVGDGGRPQGMKAWRRLCPTACCDDHPHRSIAQSTAKSCPPTFMTLSTFDGNTGICAFHLRGAREDCPRPAASLCLSPPPSTPSFPPHRGKSHGKCPFCGANFLYPLNTLGLGMSLMILLQDFMERRPTRAGTLTR